MGLKVSQPCDQKRGVGYRPRTLWVGVRGDDLGAQLQPVGCLKRDAMGFRL